MSGGTIEGPTVVIGADASRVETALSGLKSQFSSFGSELSGISNGFNLDNVASQFDRVAGGMQKMGAAMSLIGVPMGLIAKESINMYADLESQIQRNTALLGGGKAEYEQILALSKELGASSPFDALEISKGIESLAAAGYSLQEIQAAMPTITNMAVATGEDLNSVSEILVATLNSYGESADKAAMYGDKLATIANISSAGVTDFGESIKYVGGVVKAFDVDIDELGAVLGALADVNIKGSSAGTALRSIITDLVSPTAAVNDIFASFGLTMDELNPKTNDFVEILQKMKDAGVSDEALMAAFQERGGPVAIQMINQLDKIKENYNTLQNESAGMLEDFAAQMRDTLKFVMDEMGGTISNIMIEIGEGLKPIVEEIGAWLNENQDTMVEFAKNAVDGLTPFVTKFMDLAKKLMDWFNSLPKDLQSKIAGLTGLGGAMATIGGPLLLLGSLPVSGIAKIAGALKELFSLGNAAGGIAGGGLGLSTVATDITALGTASAGAKGAVGLLAGTIGTLAAVVAGVAIGAWVYDVGNFRDEVSKLPGDIAEIAGGLANVISGDSAGWSQAGRGAASLFVDGFNSGVELVKGSPEVISNIFADAIEATALSFTGLVDGFYQAFKDQSNQTITVGKPDTSEYPQAGRDAAADFVKAANDFFSSNPITAPWVEAGKTVAEEINRINQQVVIDQNNWLSDDKAWHTFEGQLADALISSGKRVRTFSSQSEADMWNAANEWQEAFKKSGMGFEDWLNSLNSFDGRKFREVARDFSSTFGIEIQKVYEMFANQEIVPLKFDTSGFGNVYYEYQNGVYQPIMNNPVMIQVDEGTASGAFASLVDQWEQVKAQIEANPANPKINVEGSRGNLQQAWKNSIAINPDRSKWQYSNEDVKLNPITGKYEKVVQQASEAGTSEGAKQGVTQGLDKWLASHGKQPSDIDAILKSPTQTAAYQKLMEKELNKEWGSQKETSSGLSVGTKQIEANTEEVKSNTKGQEDLAQSFKSLDEAIAHIMTTDKSSFIYGGKKYGREQNDDGSYSWLDQSNTAKEQRNILEKQQKEAEKTSKNTEELGLQFKQGVSVQEAMLSAIQQYGGLNKAEGQKFTVGEDTYKIAIDSSGKIIAQAVSATAKVAQGQQKASEKAIEARTKAEETYNQKLIDLAAKRDEKLGDLDLSDKKYADKRAKILDDYSDRVAEAKRKYDEAQDKYNDAIKESGNTTIDASKTTKDFTKSTQEASTGLISFSDPVKSATGEVLFFGPAVSSATSTLKELGSLDIKSIIQGWLGEGELGEAQQRKANDLGALYGEDVSDRLTNGLATTISKELPKWLEWQKEGKGQSYDDVSKYKSDLWYEFANAVLKSNYAGYRDLGTRDWTFRQDVDSKLNPDTLKMTDELFTKAVEAYVKPFYDGTLKAEPGKDWLGNSDIKNNSPYYSNDWRFVNEGKTGTGTRYEDEWNKQKLNEHVAKQYTDAIKGLNENLKSGKINADQYKDHVNTLNEWQKSIKSAYSGVGEVLEADKAHLESLMKSAGITTQDVKGALNAAKTTTPQINTLNSAFEKIGLTGSGLTNVLSNVNQALSDHHANIQESQDYLKQYNDAAGENTKYTQDQERQTYSLMNSLGMLGTAQDMYNNYMSDGILDATKASSVQQALAQATKMMGDAGITAEGGISGLPGALQALASAAQAAMSQIQAAISNANTVVQNAQTTAANIFKFSQPYAINASKSSPTNFTVNMNGNSFPAGTKPGDVIRDLTGQLRIVA